jgi:rhamnosyltransferase
MNVRKKVAAVVTTFNSNESFRVNLERISHQVDLVIVVDDSGKPSRPDSASYSDISNSVILRNEGNLGIAAALNRGIELAGTMECDWIITLDDDTLVSGSYMDDVFHFVRTGVQTSAGLIACSREDSSPTVPCASTGFKTKRTLITSGCVFEIRTFHDVGGFDERLFIDLVDFDFCTRLRKSGRSLILLDKVGMAHRVGNSRVTNWLGINVLVYNHSPFRLYYQMRNVFFFAKKHMAFDPVLSFYLLLDIFRLPLKALFFEREKRARLFYLATGLRDGLCGRGGKLTRKFRDLSWRSQL